MSCVSIKPELSSGTLNMIAVNQKKKLISVERVVMPMLMTIHVIVTQSMVILQLNNKLA